MILIMLALAVSTEALVRNQVEPQDNRPGHVALLNTSTHVDAAFGDSHVARGFDAGGGFVNLAYPSENIEDMILKVQTFYQNRDPGRVIIQADPHLFSPYRIAAQAAQIRDTTPSFLVLSDEHRPRLLAYWSAFIRGGGKLVSTVEQTADGALLSDGDLALDHPRRQMRDANSRMILHRIAAQRFVNPAQDRYRALLNLLVDKGATVCLVSFPVSPAYRQAVAVLDRNSPGLSHDDIVAFYKTEAQRIDGTFVDTRTYTDDKSMYRDVDHLNAKGAQLFSNDLIEACFD